MPQEPDKLFPVGVGGAAAEARALKAAPFRTIVLAGDEERSWEPPPVKVHGRRQGREVSFLAAFGSKESAEAFLSAARERIPVQGELAVVEAKGGALLARAAAGGACLWMDPGFADGEGGRFLTAAECARMLDPEPSGSALEWTAIADLDLARSRTMEELCAIFCDESPAELGIRLGRLVEGGTVEAAPSPFDPQKRLYEPLAAFYLGFTGQSERSREFRGWFKNLMAAAFFERGNLAQELNAQAKEIRDLKKSLEFSESFKQKVKREYIKLKARLEEAERRAAGDLAAALGDLEAERAARRKDGAALSRLYQEIVELENDLLASEQWPYPMSLGEALEAA